MAVTLTFPADTSSIRLARLVASGFASQLGATVADLDDLRTMVDELCSMLVAQSEQGDEITVRLDSDGAIVHVTATAPVCQVVAARPAVRGHRAGPGRRLQGRTS